MAVNICLRFVHVVGKWLYEIKCSLSGPFVFLMSNTILIDCYGNINRKSLDNAMAVSLQCVMAHRPLDFFFICLILLKAYTIVAFQLFWKLLKVHAYIIEGDLIFAKVQKSAIKLRKVGLY